MPVFVIGLLIVCLSLSMLTISEKIAINLSLLLVLSVYQLMILNDLPATQDESFCEKIV